MLTLSNAVVVFTHGNLATSFLHHVTLLGNNTVTSADSTRLTIARASGLFTGTVTEPGRARTIRFSGVLLPKDNAGVGFFGDTNAVGHVYFGEAP